MKKSMHGRFKRKSDGRIASIIETQSFKEHNITIYTIQFEDDKTRATIYDYKFKDLWSRVNG